MNSLAIEKNNNGVIVQPFKIEALEKFVTRLNERPAASEVQVNKAAGNSNYLPVSFVTTKLDEVFAGLWNFELLREQVIANEIIGVGVLEVFHPIAQVWIKRSGSASVMIQQVSKERGGSGRISNIDDKIKNTLVKDFPHLETECLKSAAKKLGKMFGRDLNRAFEDIYSPVYTEEVNNTEGLNQAIEAMKMAAIKTDFEDIWKNYPNLQSNTEFQKNYQYYQRRNIKK
jgi:hypothetical protein